MLKFLSIQNALLTSILYLVGLVNLSYGQTNRYGMKLKESNGVFQLVNKHKICKPLKDSCSNLPEDIYKPWKGYAPKLINAEDYNNCTTKKYVFKEYATKGYVLNMKVDIPKHKTNKPCPFIIWVHGGGWIGGGTGDTTISPNQSRALYNAVIKKKGKAKLHLYPFYVHAFFNQNKSDVYADITIKNLQVC